MRLCIVKVQYLPRNTHFERRKPEKDVCLADHHASWCAFRVRLFRQKTHRKVSAGHENLSLDCLSPRRSLSREPLRANISIHSRGDPNTIKHFFFVATSHVILKAPLVFIVVNKAEVGVGARRAFETFSYIFSILVNARVESLARRLLLSFHSLLETVFPIL